MKSFFKTLVTTGGIFGAIMGLPTCGVVSLLAGLGTGVIIGVLTALVSGLLFGIPIALFTAYQRKAFEGQRHEFQSETLLYDGPANHFVRRESVGGWLFLTGQRLVFRSHKFNIQPHEWSLPLSDIHDVQTAMTAKVVPNGLRIYSASGQVDQFVVEGNRKWREQILSAKARIA